MISKIINAKPDAVYYSGYYAEGAPFDQQLVNKGYKGTFVGPDGVKDDQFIKLAGDASSNAYFTCPCIPGELIPDFESAYKTARKRRARHLLDRGLRRRDRAARRHRQGQDDPRRPAVVGQGLRRGRPEQALQVGLHR